MLPIQPKWWLCWPCAFGFKADTAFSPSQRYPALHERRPVSTDLASALSNQDTWIFNEGLGLQHCDPPAATLCCLKQGCHHDTTLFTQPRGNYWWGVNDVETCPGFSFNKNILDINADIASTTDINARGDYLERTWILKGSHRKNIPVLVYLLKHLADTLIQSDLQWSIISGPVYLRNILG